MLCGLKRVSESTFDNDPKAIVPAVDDVAIAPALDDTQLDKLSDSMLDEASGGVTTGGGCS